jgi:hypothetical protein
MLNNLIYGDYSIEGASLYGKHVAINNLLMNTENGFLVLQNSKPLIQYNNFWKVKYPIINYTVDSTNISVDPMLVNEDSLDFHLQMFSPLIHAGDPNIKNVDGTRSDIGPFGGPYGESYTYQDKAPRPPVNFSGAFESNIISLKWNKNTEADFDHYNVYKDTVANFAINTSKLVAKTKDTTLNLADSLHKAVYFKLTAIDMQGNESGTGEELSLNITEVADITPSPAEYHLFQNYPNPFNPKTIISYRIKERGYVKITVYDIKGERIGTLINEEKEEGYHETEFNPLTLGGLASGVYICRIDVKDRNNVPVFSSSNKLIYLK